MKVGGDSVVEVSMHGSVVEAILVSVGETVLGMIEVVVNIIVGAVVEVSVHVRLIDVVSITVVEATMETVMAPVGSVEVLAVERKHCLKRIKDYKLYQVLAL